MKSNHLSEMNAEASLGRLFSQQEASILEQQYSSAFISAVPVIDARASPCLRARVAE